MRAFDEAGVRVYALSYDEADALADFRDAYDITYTLLSDPDSEVIRQFGILNTLIAGDDHPWFGIPFPGSYVLDGDGLITHKFFENNLAVRAGPEQLLNATGAASFDSQELRLADRPSNEQAEVVTQVFLDGEHLAVSVLCDLVARFEIPQGRHIYAAPAPQGSVAVDLELDRNSMVVTRELVRPEGKAHTLTSTGETFDVHHGSVELRQPITISGSLTTDGAVQEVTLTGTLRWQTCDDAICDIPGSERFELTVPIVGSLVPEFMARPGNPRVREMNGARHFQRMRERHQSDDVDS